MATAERLHRRCLGDIAFTTGTLAAMLDTLRRRAQRGPETPCLVGFLNPHVYNVAHRAASVRRFLHDADIVCIDGIGVVLGARPLGQGRLARVVATQLFEAILGTPEIRGRAVLIGVTGAEVRDAAAAMNDRSDGLRVVAALDGFAPVDAYERVFADDPNLDAVLVGAGTPKSEEILLAATRRCRHALGFHIGGGTIRLYAGTKRRAPAWLAAHGGEWLHRLVFEPETRGRYLAGGLEFGGHILRAAIAARSRRQGSCES